MSYFILILFPHHVAAASSSPLQTVNAQTLPTVCPAHCFIRRGAPASVYAHWFFQPLHPERAGELISGALERAGMGEEEGEPNTGCHGLLFFLCERKKALGRTSHHSCTPASIVHVGVCEIHLSTERTSPRLQAANFQRRAQNESHPRLLNLCPVLTQTGMN